MVLPCFQHADSRIERWRHFAAWKSRVLRWCVRTVLSFVLIVNASLAFAEDAPAQVLSLRTQLTHLWQYHPAFQSLDRGANSLDSGSRGNETTDVTLYVGIRLWDGAEIEADPEIDQGFGLSNTMGVAAFPSGEAYKLGKAMPYLRLQRLFVRQTIHFGQSEAEGDPSPDQIEGVPPNNTLLLTAGKFSIVDIFDTNVFAHDPRADFMNWAVIDAGAFDYAGDAWGYSYGLAAEWTHHQWTLRVGLFNLSKMPGSTELQRDFGQFEFVGEIERRYALWGEDGTLKLLGFLNRGRMGAYADAVRRAAVTHTTPNTAFVRATMSRSGGELNLEQPLNDTLGLFARASINDGSKETFDFTDINASLAAGLSLKGASWGRPKDSIGIAAVESEISKSARAYFAAGGLGLLIGDGKLARYGSEHILETYYDMAVSDGVAVTADYQWIANPAYNRDRGPVSVLGIRFHLET